MKKLLWYIIAGTKGGVNRARIINKLNERPYNTNQLANMLDLDYKTVQHHLQVLQKNRMVTVEGDGYGDVYFISSELERNYEEFLKIWGKVNGEDK